MAVIIRERTDDDLPSCVEALRAVYEASRYPTAWPADPSAWLVPPAEEAAYVAEVDGRIVGQVGALAGESEPGLAQATGVPAAGLVLVTRLFVSPEGRGLGLARALVGRIVEHAAAQGKRAGLDVIETSAPAIALYESLGWELRGTGRAQWTTQDGNHPQIRYYLAPAQ